ncbi:MAG: DEAD/DEAH box helicase [Opitutales bacterium]|nr:DEAD/DEAH box helicase [Opitutales bacterium]
MNIFSVHRSIVEDDRNYIGSFVNIADPVMGKVVNEALETGKLWPEPLLHFNPSFEEAGAITKILEEHSLHPDFAHIFRGYTLFKHQTDAIRLGLAGRDFVVTSGTGSGKSLTYIATIFQHILTRPKRPGVQAIIEDLERLPPAWVRQRKSGELVPVKAYARRLPRPISYGSDGSYSEDDDLPLRGWFMPTPLLFDPSAGLFFDGNTKENTKLASLGAEGRSTSTTVTAFSSLSHLAGADLPIREQKPLPGRLPRPPHRRPRHLRAPAYKQEQRLTTPNHRLLCFHPCLCP